MKFKLSDIETERDIAQLLRKRTGKTPEKLTHQPKESVPYKNFDFSKFIDYSYDVDEDAYKEKSK